MIDKSWELLSRGAVGCLIVAGGQGSRLGFDHPKGCYPVSAVRKKTLFQIFAEKIVAASKACGHPIPLAIMTAPETFDDVRAFFHAHKRFGLKFDQLTLFAQSTLPVIDDHSKPVGVDAPAGNGWALKHLYDQGIWQRWQNQGVQHVFFCQIDNALLDPVDPAMLAAHIEKKTDITVKAVRRHDPKEPVGLLLPEGKGWKVVEYSEVDETTRNARDSEGSLGFANISAFCFSMGFIRRAAEQLADKMPIHRALKKIPGLESRGQLYKQERFIFDLLPASDHVTLFPCERADCFAPLKSAQGEGSPDTVRDALMDFDRRVFQNLTRELPPDPIELDPAFYYLRNHKPKKWQNDGGYVTLLDS